MAEVTDLNYGQIRGRIAADLNRDDLDTSPLSAESIIHQYFLERVVYYSREFFFNAKFLDLSKTTVVGDQWLNLPVGWQDVQSVRLLQGGANWLPVARVPHETILHLHVITPPTKSLPSLFALHPNPTGGAMAIRFFAAPDLAYPVEIAMDKPPVAPTADNDISFWTQEAQALMVSAVSEEICRHRINRPLKADEHAKKRETEEASLNSKSIRIGGGLRARMHF